MGDGRKIIVNIPAYNEEKTIGNVVRDVINNGYRNVVVIDDGSTDRTAEIARKSGAIVISHKKNLGLGNGFKTGVNYALMSNADIFVNIDADGQFCPEEIGKLIEPILNNEADMVTGSRFLNESFVTNMPLIKRVGNKFFTNVVSRITSKRFTDTQCGFRAYSRDALKKLNLMGGFTYTQEVFIDLAVKGMRIKEVPIKVNYHKDRKSRVASSLTKYGLKSLLIIMKTFRDYKPLKFFGIPGIGLFTIGFITGIFMIMWYIMHKATTPFKSLLFFCIATLILGTIIIVLGLIADMLDRVRMNQEEIMSRIRDIDEKIKGKNKIEVK